MLVSFCFFLPGSMIISSYFAIIFPLFFASLTTHPPHEHIARPTPYSHTHTNFFFWILFHNQWKHIMSLYLVLHSMVLILCRLLRFGRLEFVRMLCFWVNLQRFYSMPPFAFFFFLVSTYVCATTPHTHKHNSRICKCIGVTITCVKWMYRLCNIDHSEVVHECVRV